MIKKLICFLLGIDPNIDSHESQDSWERKRYLDENDLSDFDFDSDATDDNDDSDRAGENFAGWLGLW